MSCSFSGQLPSGALGKARRRHRPATAIKGSRYRLYHTRSLMLRCSTLDLPLIPSSSSARPVERRYLVLPSLVAYSLSVLSYLNAPLRSPPEDQLCSRYPCSRVPEVVLVYNAILISFTICIRYDTFTRLQLCFEQIAAPPSVLLLKELSNLMLRNIALVKIPIITLQKSGTRWFLPGGHAPSRLQGIHESGVAILWHGLLVVVYVDPRRHDGLSPQSAQNISTNLVMTLQDHKKTAVCPNLLFQVINRRGNLSFICQKVSVAVERDSAHVGIKCNRLTNYRAFHS